MHDINTLPKLSTTSTTNAQELLRWENNILVYLLHYTLANYFLPGYEPSSPNKPNKPVWCSGNTSMYCSPLSGGGPSTHVVRETLVQIQALAFIFFSFFFFSLFFSSVVSRHALHANTNQLGHSRFTRRGIYLITRTVMIYYT